MTSDAPLTPHIGPHSPSVDWDGWWFVGTSDSESGWQAVKLGVTLGWLDGREFDLAPGDTARVVVDLRLWSNERHEFIVSSDRFTRWDVRFRREGLDLNVADQVAVRATGQTITWRYELSPDLEVKLRCELDPPFWWPDITLKWNSYSMFSCDAKFSAEVVEGDERSSFAGLGAFDHNFGRNVESALSPGLGCWLYEPVAWEGTWTSGIYSIVGRDGSILMSMGYVSIPGLRMESSEDVSVQYMEYVPGLSLPSVWRVKIATTQEVVEYESRLSPEWQAHLARVAAGDLPMINIENAFVLCEGTYTNSSGDSRRIKGKASTEFIPGPLVPVLAEPMGPRQGFVDSSWS